MKQRMMICIFSCMIFMLSIASAQTLETYFNKANQLYEKSENKQALELYQKIYDQGMYSSELFYNMGNAYFRLNDTGRALLYFEKAYRLSPRDKDIRYNRAMLLSRTGQKEQVWETIIEYMTFNELVVSCLILYAAFFTLRMLKWYMRKKWMSVAQFVILLFGVCFGVWLTASYFTLYRYPTAIVLDEDANVQSSPNLDSTIVFTVPVGKKLVMLDQSENWVSIGLQEHGLKGWIQNKHIEKI